MTTGEPIAVEVRLPSSKSRSCESPPPPDADRTSEDVIREWVARFAVNCGQQLSEARVLMWIDELSDIEPDRLIHAFPAVEHSHTFNSIPQIGDIRAKIDQAESDARTIEAKTVWERVLMAASLGGHIEDFDAVTQHALDRSAWSYLVHCDNYEGAKWAEKQFIAAYIRLHETRRAEHLLGEGEAKKIIRRLGAELKRAAPKEPPPIAAPVAFASLAPGKLGEIRSKLATLREQKSQSEPEPKPTMT
jgi:hypothetical protein